MIPGYGATAEDTEAYQDEDGVVHGSRRNGHGPPAADDDLLAGLRTGGWLDGAEFPPLSYTVPGLLAEGMALLVGPPKIGKSWFVLGVALAVAVGGAALGTIAVQRRPVLLLALEDGDRRLQDRCRILLGPHEPIPAELQYLTRIRPGRVLDTITAWLDRHPGTAPLVILDTLGKAMPPALPGESAYARDYRVGGALKRVIDAHPGACLLINHHDRKAGGDDFVDAVSGTHGLAGAADSILVLDRPRHDPEGTVKVTGRDVAEGEYALRLDGIGSWRTIGGDLRAAAEAAERVRATAGLGDRSVQVVEFVSRHPDGVRASEVEAALGEQARRYLARLAESGRLRKLGRGVYAPPCTPVPTVPSVPSGEDDTPPDGTTGHMGQPPEGGTASGRWRVSGHPIDDPEEN